MEFQHRADGELTKMCSLGSAYAACEITKSSSKSDFNIQYNGPMHIVIRSGKHDSSTAYTHGRDFDKLLTLDESDTVTKNDGQVKLTVISLVDGSCLLFFVDVING